MRRCVKYRATIMLLVGLTLAASVPSFAAVNAVEDSTWNVWPSTVYYFAELSGPSTETAPYTSCTVHITAVDKYELYINGTRIDTPATNDGNYATIDSMAVTLTTTSTIRVAVKVENSGLGNGNGLLVDIKAGDDWLGTTTMKRRSVYDEVSTLVTTYPSLWYYYIGDVVAATGMAAWYNYAPWDKTVDVLEAKGFGEVIDGTMEPIDYTPDPHVTVVAGYSGGIETGSHAGGGIGLRKIDGENIARGKTCATAGSKLTDGDLSASSTYTYTNDPTDRDSTVMINLGDYYLLKKMRIYTGGASGWPKKAVKGYTAYSSMTGAKPWTELGSMSGAGVTNIDNGGYDYSEVVFKETYGKYVRHIITEANTGIPVMGEIMVFGTGYIYDGAYTSPWNDLGTPGVAKNFKTVTWSGEIPTGTSISVQTQTIDAAGDTSVWSDKNTAKSFDFSSPEPAVKFRYRVNLSTNTVSSTPVLKSLAVSYSSVGQPLVTGAVSVSPAIVPMNVDTTFACTISYALATGEGIKTVLVTVPGMAFADSVVITDGSVRTLLTEVGGDFVSASTSDTLQVTFRNVVIDSVANAGIDTMRVYFRTRLLKSVYDFQCGVVNAGGNDGAGPLMLGSLSSGAMRVVTNSVVDILSDVKAVPKAFTPNGDGKNDFTVIEFGLAKADAHVTIKIFNSKGRLIVTLHDEMTSAADYRIPDSQKLGSAALAQVLPGYWDGRDDDGKLVPPGIYVYQVLIDSDNGEVVKKGAVAVGY